MNERHHYDLCLSLRGGKRCLVLRRRIGSLAAEVACAEIGQGPVVLRIEAERESFSFSGAAGDGRFLELGAGESRYLATEVAGGFTGLYLAMFSSGNGSPCSSPADFDWFEYSPS
jgi:xylan 1,4-beta-xylosidase